MDDIQISKNICSPSFAASTKTADSLTVIRSTVALGYHPTNPRIQNPAGSTAAPGYRPARTLPEPLPEPCRQSDGNPVPNGSEFSCRRRPKVDYKLIYSLISV